MGWTPQSRSSAPKIIAGNLLVDCAIITTAGEWLGTIGLKMLNEGEINNRGTTLFPW